VSRDIAQWQRDFYAGPSVWVVTDPDGIVSNIYESREAAMLEINREERRGARYRVHEEHIHSMDLSRRRWGEAP
jgi:hypothetical protein